MIEETKLRSIPVERGGRYVIIVELARPITSYNIEQLDHQVRMLNHWLTEEDTPFGVIGCVPGAEIRFERVKAATDEAQHEDD